MGKLVFFIQYLDGYFFLPLCLQLSTAVNRKAASAAGLNKIAPASAATPRLHSLAFMHAQYKVIIITVSHWPFPIQLEYMASHFFISSDKMADRYQMLRKE